MCGSQQLERSTQLRRSGRVTTNLPSSSFLGLGGNLGAFHHESQKLANSTSMREDTSQKELFREELHEKVWSRLSTKLGEADCRQSVSLCVRISGTLQRRGLRPRRGSFRRPLPENPRLPSASDDAKDSPQSFSPEAIEVPSQSNSESL